MEAKRENIQNLRSDVSMLPGKPGVYLLADKDGTVIYVGKAKHLRNRVGSYFAKSVSGKTAVMMRKVQTVEHVVVDTETDALLLENNLIKKYQPRYNLLLKDDKSFPWICIKNEPFPRIYHTRNKINDGSKYFGPYTSMVMVRTLLDLIRQLYPIRNCNYHLTKENIDKRKFKICLEFHMENCKGPCEGLQQQEEYNQNVDLVEEILKGNIYTVIAYLKKTMKEYAADYQYEEANYIKDKIEIIERYQSKSTVVSPTLGNLDVFSYIEDKDYVYINYLKVIQGALIQAHTVEIKRRLEEPKEELLLFAITEIRERMFSSAKEIIVPFRLTYPIPVCKISVPRKGDKFKLLELSERNVTYYKLDKNKKKIETITPPRPARKLNKLAHDLRLKEIPVKIECFDNSNIQGKNPVAACVVFYNARPAKKEYRHYNIKTVEGVDDFASMREVITRRYRRLIKENKQLPQLIVIDGGKGQLNAAVDSIERLGLKGKIAIVGIAKRLEEIYYPGDPVPLYLDKNSESLRLLQHLRNEAHRFGISFHREKRSKEQVKSILDGVNGIGPKSKQNLLLEFKTIGGIKNATLNQLEKCVGPSKAKLIYKLFHELA